ncbi:MAG: hypothetical protein V3U79_11985 [Dehalococcoidia bacterium]
MPLGSFVDAGSIPRPLILGRTLRLAFGGGALFYFIWNIIAFDDRVGSDIPAVGYWVGVGFAFYYLSDLVDITFGRAWGRWPHVAVLPIALALVIADLVAYESGWGPPLSWGLFIMVEFFFVTLGISFLLAGALGVPG